MSYSGSGNGEQRGSSNDSTIERQQQFFGSNGIQSYKEMLQSMKKAQATLEELQDQALELQEQFAETHFAASMLFEPEIVEMMTSSEKGLASKKTVRDNYSSGSTEEDMDTDVDDKCAKMDEKLDNMLASVSEDKM